MDKKEILKFCAQYVCDAVTNPGLRPRLKLTLNTGEVRLGVLIRLHFSTEDFGTSDERTFVEYLFEYGNAVQAGFIEGIASIEYAQN